MNEEKSGAQQDLQHVGDVVEGVVAALGARVGLGEGAVLWSQWSSIVGDEWADARPVRLKDGTLVVTVSNGIAATRLRYATAALIERIEARIGRNLVSNVRVQIERSKSSR